jgi:hypothetical protein
VVAAALIDPASTALTRLLASSLHARLLPTQQNGSPTDAAAADGTASCAQCGSTSQPAQSSGRFQPAAACAVPQNGTDDRCVGEARQVRAQGPTACCFGAMCGDKYLPRFVGVTTAALRKYVLEVLKHRVGNWRLPLLLQTVDIVSSGLGAMVCTSFFVSRGQVSRNPSQLECGALAAAPALAIVSQANQCPNTCRRIEM